MPTGTPFKLTNLRFGSKNISEGIFPTSLQANISNDSNDVRLASPAGQRPDKRGGRPVRGSGESLQYAFETCKMQIQCIRVVEYDAHGDFRYFSIVALDSLPIDTKIRNVATVPTS